MIVNMLGLNRRTRRTTAKGLLALMLIQHARTPARFDGRSFGTNMNEAMLTSYAGKEHRLSDDELNGLIDELGIKPSVL